MFNIFFTILPVFMRSTQPCTAASLGKYLIKLLGSIDLLLLLTLCSRISHRCIVLTKNETYCIATGVNIITSVRLLWNRVRGKQLKHLVSHGSSLCEYLQDYRKNPLFFTIWLWSSLNNLQNECEVGSWKPIQAPSCADYCAYAGLRVLNIIFGHYPRQALKPYHLQIPLCCNPLRRVSLC
ncbi:LAFA_0C00122g1_1 [Lachancea sp. 'fantastica']|nr:LAFA_0C00122g1_1 [Lachancea sp. 'fantastica']